MSAAITPPQDHVREHEDELPDEIVSKAIEILNSTDRWQYGRSPKNSAAAAVYYGSYATDEDISQARAAEIFDVGVTSIRNNREWVVDQINSSV